MISLAVLAMTSAGGFSAFLLLNKYAANLRNMSVARSLCQERIEQALTLGFRPASSIVPLAPSPDLVAYPTPTPPASPNICPILGPATSYNSTGAYTGSTTAAVTTETIPVFTQTESITGNSSSASNATTASGVVTYTRTTSVAPAGLTSTTVVGGTVTSSTNSLNLIQVTVTVTYAFRGQQYSTSMVTFRGSD